MSPPLALGRAAEAAATFRLLEDGLFGVDMPPPSAEARTVGAAAVLSQRRFFGITYPGGVLGVVYPMGFFFDEEPVEPVQSTKPMGLGRSLAAAPFLHVPTFSP